MSESSSVYPLQIEGQMAPKLNRWLWIVKALMLIPHFVVLFFLWVGVFVSTVIAFFAILFTGRYPRGIFDFNVGVLRWSWRVGFYSFYAIGTDRYPPFSLKDEPDYPAHLEVAYPQSLSRGLVLVKWWLLAIPHYLVVGVFGGLGWAATSNNDYAGAGLIELLVVFAGIALLFTGRYPKSLFAFVMGMNRWVFRVAVYSLLMTDAYPPFRLDMGGEEPPATASEAIPIPAV